MSEVLSQEEIDMLINAMATGNGDIKTTGNEKKKVKVYDFARPSKFSKEQLRTLEVIFEDFARMASSFLTGYLKATKIEVLSSEQVTYGEFINSVLNPAILIIIDLKPFKGSLVFDLSSSIGYAMIDRILGGQGNPITEIRDFTEIEIILISKMMEPFINLLIEPWKQFCDIKPVIEKVITNPQFGHIMSPNEMVALITLNVKLGELQGFMNLCIPYSVIEPIVGKLNTKNWFSSDDIGNDGKFKHFVEKSLEEVFIPISAIIGKTNITVDEFVNIQVGDVITLDSYVNSDFKVKVGDLTKFYGKPGINKGKNSIQITSVIRRG